MEQDRKYFAQRRLEKLEKEFGETKDKERLFEIEAEICELKGIITGDC